MYDTFGAEGLKLIITPITETVLVRCCLIITIHQQRQNLEAQQKLVTHARDYNIFRKYTSNINVT